MSQDPCRAGSARTLRRMVAGLLYTVNLRSGWKRFSSTAKYRHALVPLTKLEHACCIGHGGYFAFTFALERDNGGRFQAQNDAPPNGGRAESPGNSEVCGGLPSVS
jgi:hypothetical protein